MDGNAAPDPGLYVEATMIDRKVAYARLHLCAWALWAATWVVAIIRAGEIRILADTPAEYVELGILFASCITLVLSAIAARLRVGGMRATSGPISSVAAMLGLMLPAAFRQARGMKPSHPDVTPG